MGPSQRDAGGKDHAFAGPGLSFGGYQSVLCAYYESAFLSQVGSLHNKDTPSNGLNCFAILFHAQTWQV